MAVCEINASISTFDFVKMRNAAISTLVLHVAQPRLSCVDDYLSKMDMLTVQEWMVVHVAGSRNADSATLCKFATDSVKMSEQKKC